MMLTKEVIQQAVPANVKNAITDDVVNTLNNIVTDPVFADQYRQNFLSYTGVMREGKFKIEDYMSAVMYVSYKLMGDSNLEAYGKTFPQRYQALLAKGTSSKDIAAYVSAYNKGKLVNLIMEQSLVPSWVLNQHLYQEALSVQAHLMNNAVSEKVRTEAANSILVNLKKPEALKAQISMEMADNSGMNELKNALQGLAAQQRELIQNGVEVKQIAASTLVEGEARDVTDD
jgi:hypothetical protein